MVKYSKRRTKRKHPKYYKKKKMLRPKYGQCIQRQLLTSDRMFVKLRYVDAETPIIDLNGTLVNASYKYNQYLMNGLASPNVSTGVSISDGRIPGFIEWGHLYSKYRVHGCQVRYEAINNSVTNPCFMFLHLQDDPSPVVFNTWQNIRRLEGNRYTDFRVLGNSGGQNRGMIKRYVDLAKFSGSPSEYRSDIGYSGVIQSDNGGPSSSTNAANRFVAYAGAMTTNAGAVVSTFPISVNLRITYYVELYERRDTPGTQPANLITLPLTNNSLDEFAYAITAN